MISEEYYTIPLLDFTNKTEITDNLPRVNDETFAVPETIEVMDLVIGRRNYGEVRFPGVTNVTNININKEVLIGKHSIEIYPKDQSKPINSELNKAAFVTFFNVWPRKEANQTDFINKLKRATDKMGAVFQEYQTDNGKLIFQVPHFSKYELNDSDEEIEIDPPLKQDINAQGKQPQNAFQDVNQALESQTLIKATAVKKNNLINAFEDAIDDPEPDLFNISMGEDLKDVFSPNYANMELRYDPKRIFGMKATLFDDEYEMEDENQFKEMSVEPVHTKKVKEKKIKQVQAPQDEIPEKTEDLLQHHKFLINPVDWQSYEVSKYYGTSKHLTKLLPLKESILSEKQNLVADSGCFMSRSFRVGWGPEWQLIHQGSVAVSNRNPDNPYNLFSTLKSSDRSKTSSGFCLNKLKLESFGLQEHLDENMIKNLVKNLEVVLQHSLLVQDNQAPYFSSQEGVSLLEEIAELNSSFESEDRTTRHAQVMWNLCIALWGSAITDEPPNSYNYREDRKAALTNWLIDSTSTQILQEIQNIGYPLNLFSLLTGRQIEEATNLAIEHHDFRLALLISQASGSGITRLLIRRQLENWHQFQVEEHIVKQRLKIYALLAGCMVWNANSELSLNCCQNLDWKRAFAIHLWYNCPATASICDALTDYNNSFQGTSAYGSYSQPPHPAYIEEDPELLMSLFEEELDGAGSQPSPYDVCYHILKLYCDRSLRLDKLLAPNTYSASNLDYSLSWPLYQVLQALGYSHLHSLKEHQLHNDFATQLEALGAWEWAVFVLLHISNATRRKAAVMECLNRHVQLKEDQLYLQKETFLIERLSVPEEWISSGKALLAKSCGDHRKEAWFLLRSGNWNRSHQVIMKHLAPDCIINEDFDYLMKFLTELSEPSRSTNILDWSNGGEVCLDYIQVCKGLDKVLCGEVNAYDLEALQPKLVSLANRISNLSCTTAKETLCQSEMAKKTATLFRTLIEIRNAKEGRITGEHLMALHINKLPMPEDYALQELRAMVRSYMLQLNSQHL